MNLMDITKIKKINPKPCWIGKIEIYLQNIVGVFKVFDPRCMNG